MSKTTRTQRIDDEVDQYVLRHQRPRETFNQTLRRLLGLEKRADEGARDTRQERRGVA